MIIKNVKVYGEDFQFHPGDVVIENGVFCETASNTGEVIDGEGAYAIPGLIDIHFHGCMGADVCDNDPEAIRTIAEYEASVGVTTICPATMTLPVDDLKKILSTVASYTNESGAHLVGLNMEGPFISVSKKGAQDERNIIPCDAALFREFQEAARGLIRFIGVAPETGLDRTLDFIREVKGEVSVSLAHTNASYTDAKAAFDAGACHAVHLFNAMPAFTHREPGVVGAVFDSKHVFAELICDGCFRNDGIRADLPDQRQYACCRNAGRLLHIRRTCCQCFRKARHPGKGRCTGRFRDESCRLYAYRSQRDGHSSGGGHPLRYPQSGACPASGAPLWKYRPWKDRKPGSFESGSFLKAGHRQRLDKGGADFESSGFQISTRISLSYRRALLLSWQMDLPGVYGL